MSSEDFYGTDYGTNIYVCLYCDAYVGTHGRSRRPLGSLANEPLRTARKVAHGVFDLIWQHGHMTRAGAYRWMGLCMGLSSKEAHIGQFNVEQCKTITTLAIRFYLTNGELLDCPRCQGSGDEGDPLDMLDYRPCERCNGAGTIQRGDYFAYRGK